MKLVGVERLQPVGTQMLPGGCVEFREIQSCLGTRESFIEYVKRVAIGTMNLIMDSILAHRDFARMELLFHEDVLLSKFLTRLTTHR